MLDEYDDLKAFAMKRFAIEEDYCANGAQASDGCVSYADDYECEYDECEYDEYEGYTW